MFHVDYAHTGKGMVKYKNAAGQTKTKRAPSCINRFHYITRTKHHSNEKEGEEVEFVKSGNMPEFAKDRPDQFWQAAELYERKNGRTSTSLIIALPKELSKQQRIELVEDLIKQFTEEFNLPYSCAIHSHAGAISGQDQPHLHLMYSERSVDEYIRTAEQFFSRYNPKNPHLGGAKKVTADERGLGKDLINQVRAETEVIMNEHLTVNAPTKIVEIKGIRVEVPNIVSCLNHTDYNKKYGTNLKAVPMMTKSMLRLDPAKTDQDDEYKAKLVERAAMIQKITDLRDHNNFELYQQYYCVELNRRKKIEAEIKIEPVVVKPVESPKSLSAQHFANKLEFVTYFKTTEQLKEIQKLSKVQDSSGIDYITAIERKIALLNDVAVIENSAKTSALINEIYKNDVLVIDERSKGRGLTYDEYAIKYRLNQCIQRYEAINLVNVQPNQKPQQTQNNDNLNDFFNP